MTDVEGAAAASATHYTWTDGHGQTHIGQPPSPDETPPESSSAVEDDQPPSPEGMSVEGASAIGPESDPSSEEKVMYDQPKTEWLREWRRKALQEGIISRPVEPGSEPEGGIATGHEEWRMCCGNKKCNTVKFNIIRDQPEKGPFRWQEVTVTM